MNINKQYEFIKMLNGLLKKGYQLNEALTILNSVHSKLIKNMKLMLDCGLSLSETFKKLKFMKLVYETITIGETANRLNDVINMIESYLAFHIQMKSQMNKVLMYPLMLIFMALISFEFIRLKLYPVIETLLSQFKVNQNQLMIFMSFNLLKIIGALILILGITICFFKTIPNILPVVKHYRCLYVAYNLKILLNCGYSLEGSMMLLSNTLNEKVYNLDELQNALFDNNYKLPSLSAFSQIFLYFFKLGINANNLSLTLDDFTSIYHDYLNNQLTKIIYYLQLIIFTILAVNILLIYYVVMIPMFTITQNI